MTLDLLSHARERKREQSIRCGGHESAGVISPFPSLPFGRPGADSYEYTSYFSERLTLLLSVKTDVCIAVITVHSGS